MTPTALKCMREIQPFSLNISTASNTVITQRYPNLSRVDQFVAQQPYALIGLQLSSSLSDNYTALAYLYGVSVLVGQNVDTAAFTQNMRALISHFNITVEIGQSQDTWVGFDDSGILIPSGSVIGLFAFRPADVPGEVWRISATCSLYLAPIQP